MTFILSIFIRLLIQINRLMKLLISLLFITIITSIQSQQIIDYTLTQSIEKTIRDSNAHYNINIIPQNIDDKYLTFPQACAIKKDLEIHQMTQYTNNNLIVNQQFINNFKNNMTDFLKLAEKLKNQRQKIKDLQLLLPSGHEKGSELILKSEEVQYIKQIEQNLQNLNNSIRQKVISLQQLILSEINRTTNNNVLNQVRLNFDYQAYQARLRYLQDIKANSSGLPDNNNHKQQNIQEYFKDIMFQNNNENKYLDLLNKLLQSYAVASEIKLRISNELKKLQAKNYVIQNKQECHKKIYTPIHQENHQEIQSIIDNLKGLKSMESSDRSSCQGVANKLLSQLKKVLKVYNYSYVCHEGLPQAQIQKKQIQQKISKLQQQLNKLQYDNNFKKIQHFYGKVKQDKELLIERITQFDINSYLLNKELLNIEIYNTKNKLENIQSHLKNPEEGEVRPFDYEKIKEMVKEINDQQLRYCKLKAKYDQQYLKIQSQVKKYEYKTNNRLQLYQEYIRKVDQLKQLQKQFNELRQWLLLSIV